MNTLVHLTMWCRQEWRYLRHIGLSQWDVER